MFCCIHNTKHIAWHIIDIKKVNVERMYELTIKVSKDANRNLAFFFSRLDTEKEPIFQKSNLSERTSYVRKSSICPLRNFLGVNII
jgi:hypothetical protein